MWQLFKSKAKSKGRVGLVVNPHAVALAHVDDRGGAPQLMACEHIALDSDKSAEKELATLVKSLDLEGVQCSYVLNARDYNLHLVEAPKVEEAELRAAVRWKIKDLLDMKVDDAAIDVFRVPEDAYRGREMVYVVAGLKSRIRGIVQMLNNVGLEPAVVDIPELAMKNISSLFIDDSNGAAFMDLRRTGSTMNITRDGNLYLTRRINTQLDPEVMQSLEWETLRDRLVLEIQRSLDYYESQMGKPPINQVYIAQRQSDSQAMTRTLDEALSARVSCLNLADKLESRVPLNPTLEQVTMAAIGATLRGMKKAQHPAQPSPSPSSQEAA